MENTMINSETLDEKPKGLDLDSIPAMAESLESGEEEILNEVSENSEPIPSEEDSRIMITQEMMDEELEKIEDMNFLELLSMERDLKSRKSSMENARLTVEQLLKTKEELRKTITENGEESLGDKLALADAEAKAGVEDDDNEEDIQSFLDNYDVSIQRLDDTIEKVREKVKEFEDIPKTTTYMNNAMIEIVDKRLKEIAETEEKDETASLRPKYKNLKRYYNNIRNLYENRDNVDWIIEKINSNKIMLRRFVDRLNKDKKQNRDTAIVGAQKSATKAFCQMFSIEQMQAFDKYLKSIFNPNDSDKDVSVFMTQYALYIVYTHPKIRRFGDQKRVEMLIMNVLDIINETYDLPNGVEYFNEQLLKIKEAVMKDLPRVKQ